MSSEATVSSLFYLYLIDVFSIWYALWFVSRSYMELKKLIYIFIWKLELQWVEGKDSERQGNLPSSDSFPC